MTEVLAPCAGSVIALADVPDPVFAAEMVGPGLAIRPVAGSAVVTAPVAGRLVKVHPHAFAISGELGVDVLVHLGINTVRLGGAGFTVLVEEGGEVAAGDGVISWNPDLVEGPEVSTEVVVIALGAAAGSVPTSAVGQQVASGDLLFALP